MDEKTSVPGLYRAENTGALINKDNKSLEAYRKRRKAAQLLPTLEARVEALENLVQKLLERVDTLETKE
jgi:uncharacterized protein YceH (UPF0502 family)